jgi:hypothetical protein
MHNNYKRPTNDVTEVSMAATTKTPTKMRMHYRHVDRAIEDLEEKQSRIADALGQLRVLRGKPVQSWNGPERRTS